MTQKYQQIYADARKTAFSQASAASMDDYDYESLADDDRSPRGVPWIKFGDWLEVYSRWPVTPGAGASKIDWSFFDLEVVPRDKLSVSADAPSSLRLSMAPCISLAQRLEHAEATGTLIPGYYVYKTNRSVAVGHYVTLRPPRPGLLHRLAIMLRLLPDVDVFTQLPLTSAEQVNTLAWVSQLAFQEVWLDPWAWQAGRLEFSLPSPKVATVVRVHRPRALPFGTTSRAQPSDGSLKSLTIGDNARWTFAATRDAQDGAAVGGSPVARQDRIFNGLDLAVCRFVEMNM